MTTDTRIAFTGDWNMAADLTVLRRTDLREILLKTLHAAHDRGAELSQEFGEGAL